MLNMTWDTILSAFLDLNTTFCFRIRRTDPLRRTFHLACIQTAHQRLSVVGNFQFKIMADTMAESEGSGSSQSTKSHLLQLSTI
jgi:hypothetical protein